MTESSRGRRGRGRAAAAVLIAAALVVAMPGIAKDLRAAEPEAPVGAWVVVEAGGMPVVANEKGVSPNLSFDPAKRQASGFGGCNRFSAGFEVDGASLRFGPVMSTRRACPGPEMDAEDRVLAALGNTRGWEIDGGELRLLDGGRVLARLARKQAGAPPLDVGSMSYRTTVLPAGMVTLSGGSYREPAAPGSASEVTVTLTDTRAFGMIGGREAGAVVLVTSTGGSGSFLELALLSHDGTGWTNTDTILLGDRVKVRSVAMEGQRITVSMTTHGPGDPACCPTLEATRNFVVRDGKLLAD